MRSPPLFRPTFESARNCKIREETDGLLINVETKQPFTYKDACVVRGPHLGYDPNSTASSQDSGQGVFESAVQTRLIRMQGAQRPAGDSEVPAGQR